MNNTLDFLTSKKERVGYYSYFFGQNIIYLFVTMFLSIYFTNSLGIPAAIVGTILLLARIWDAINDPLLAIMVEKSNLKSGKFKPWIKAVAFLVPISTILMFSFTGYLIEQSLFIRVMFTSVTYIAWGMLYTISDAPAFALSTVMTSNLNERDTIISFSRFFAYVGMLVSLVVAPIMVEKTNGNWFIISLVLSVIAFIFLYQVRYVNERVKSVEKTPTLKEIISSLFLNKYLIIYVITTLIVSGTNLASTLMPYIATDILKNPAAMSAIMATAFIPMIAVAPLTPMLVRRFGKIFLMKFSLIINIVFPVIIYLVGYDNFLAFIVLSIIRGFLSGVSMVLGALFFADCIEYDFYTKGNRCEAATFSAQTFSTKATSAISGAVSMWFLSVLGFKESIMGVVIVQSSNVINGMWAIFNLVPAGGSLIGLLFFWKFYDLSEDKLVKLSNNNELEIKI
jgi:sugar (glycoside-pentoside-hexuronide) transporter